MKLWKLFKWLPKVVTPENHDKILSEIRASGLVSEQLKQKAEDMIISIEEDFERENKWLECKPVTRDQNH